MITKINRKAERVRRHKRVRRKISGTPECPRLCVYRSNASIYAQVIDDTKGATLVAASSADKDLDLTGKTKTIMLASVGTFVVNMILNILLFFRILPPPILM